MTTYVPDVIVWPADEVDGAEAFIAGRCEAVAIHRRANPEMDDMMRRNGWSNRALVLGMLVRAAVELATDEGGAA
jgi:hypothetical protein